MSASRSSRNYFEVVNAVVAKKIVKRYLPDFDKIRRHKHLQFFGRLLHDPNLWHLNRRSVSGGTAVGLFMAFLPIPLQTIPAAASAIFFRVNLPISVAWVWITNPLTMAPVFVAAYTVGSWLLGTPAEAVQFNMSMEWFRSSLSHVWRPFLLGSIILSTASATAGYFLMQGLWRWHVVRDWERRREKRRSRSE